MSFVCVYVFPRLTECIICQNHFSLSRSRARWISTNGSRGLSLVRCWPILVSTERERERERKREGERPIYPVNYQRENSIRVEERSQLCVTTTRKDKLRQERSVDTRAHTVDDAIIIRSFSAFSSKQTMYHPSMWHPIPALDMAAAFRSMRQTACSPNSVGTSPEKSALFNPTHGAFSVSTLLNQASPDHLRFPSTHHPSLTAAAAVHQHQLFSSLFHHYPYAAAFRPLLNGTTGLLTSSTGSNSSLSSSSSSSVARLLGVRPGRQEVQEQRARREPLRQFVVGEEQRRELRQVLR